MSIGTDPAQLKEINLLLKVRTVELKDIVLFFACNIVFSFYKTLKTCFKPHMQCGTMVVHRSIKYELSGS